MFDPFGNDDDWLEVSDIDGHRAAMKRIGSVQLDGETYLILGAVKESSTGEPEGGILVVREKLMQGNQQAYVVEHSREKIERIVGTFIMRTISEHMVQEEEFADMPDEFFNCGMQHAHGEFCFCNDPQYLQ